MVGGGEAGASDDACLPPPRHLDILVYWTRQSSDIIAPRCPTPPPPRRRRRRCARPLRVGAGCLCHAAAARRPRARSGSAATTASASQFVQSSSIGRLVGGGGVGKRGCARCSRSNKKWQEMTNVCMCIHLLSFSFFPRRRPRARPLSSRRRTSSGSAGWGARSGTSCRSPRSRRSCPCSSRG